MVRWDHNTQSEIFEIEYPGKYKVNLRSVLAVTVINFTSARWISASEEKTLKASRGTVKTSTRIANDLLFTHISSSGDI